MTGLIDNDSFTYLIGGKSDGSDAFVTSFLCTFLLIFYCLRCLNKVVFLMASGPPNKRLKQTLLSFSEKKKDESIGKQNIDTRLSTF
jgi:hypothetical protein